MEYAERLGVPLRWWVQGTMLVATPVAGRRGRAARPRRPGRSPRVALALLALVLLVLRLRPGRRSPTACSAPAGPGSGSSTSARSTALDAEETRRVAGPDADARAYLLLRPYLKRAVRVEITDPADPAPYWLVSTAPPRRAGRRRCTADSRPRMAAAMAG